MGELGPHIQEQHLALFCHQLRKRGGNAWGDERGAQTLVADRGVLAKLGVNGKPSIELELVLLCTPIVPKEIGGYAEQPGAEASLLGIEVIASSEGDGERLGCQVISEGRADPTSDEAMDGWEVVLEASLKALAVGDQPMAGSSLIPWPSAPHTHVLSPTTVAFPGRMGPQGTTPDLVGLLISLEILVKRDPQAAKPAVRDPSRSPLGTGWQSGLAFPR